jgi:ketopantoate reductase
MLTAIRLKVSVNRAQPMEDDLNVSAGTWGATFGGALFGAVWQEFLTRWLLDLENGGRLELDWFSGAVARFGDDLGVPTPVHHVIYAALKRIDDKGRPGVRRRHESVAAC